MQAMKRKFFLMVSGFERRRQLQEEQEQTPGQQATVVLKENDDWVVRKPVEVEG